MFWQRIGGNKGMCILGISDVNILQSSKTAHFSHYSTTAVLDGSRSAQNISYRWSIRKYVTAHYDNDGKILFEYTRIVLLSIAIYQRHKMVLILLIWQHLLYAMGPQ